MIAIAWKGTFILAAAFLAAALLRWRSAALRHFLWTTAFAALLLLPALAWRMPGLPFGRAAGPDLKIPEFLAAQSFVQTEPQPTQPAREVPWRIFYVPGFLLAASWFLLGAARTSRLVRHGAPAPQFGADAVTTAATAMPLAWGILRPLVVLPAAAFDWPEARLRSILLHERMHHRRRDLLAQAIAQAACCVFWFHPLAWIALGRQRSERERACDDAVLETGVAPADYAGHLMEVVRAVAARRGSWADAPAMAEASNLELRVRALLDGARDRRPLTRRGAATIAAAVLAVLVPLAALQLHAQAAGGTLTGIVQDPSAAVVPQCRVTAKNLDGANQEVTRTNAAGEYLFVSIPPGHYSLEFGAPGFALSKVNAELVSGAVARVDAQLEVGQVVEAVTVNGERPAPVVPSQVPHTTPQRIRVGGNIQACKLLRQTRPAYPPELQQAGVHGTVVIRAVISKEGSVLNPKVVNTSIDARLAQAALDAVAQWQYQPTLLNGQPIETLTTITVDFQLDQDYKTPR